MNFNKLIDAAVETGAEATEQHNFSHYNAVNASMSNEEYRIHYQALEPVVSTPEIEALGVANSAVPLVPKSSSPSSNSSCPALSYNNCKDYGCNTGLPMKNGIPLLQNNVENMFIDPLSTLKVDTNIKNTILSNLKASKEINKARLAEVREHDINNMFSAFENNPITPLSCINFNTPNFAWNNVSSDLREVIDCLSSEVLIDKEAILLGVLGCISTSSRGSIEVSLSDRWKEPLIDYVCVVSMAGTRKSSLVNFLRRPFESFTQNYLQENAESIASSIEKQSMLNRIKNKVYNKRAKEIAEEIASDVPCNSLAIENWLMEFTEKTRPLSGVGVACSPQLFIDDTSKNKLIMTLAQQGGCLSILSPEGSGYLEMIRKDKEILALVLKGYDMEEHDGLYMGRKHVNLKNPALPTVLMVQPNIAYKFFENSSFREVGLTPRFSPYFSSGNSSARGEYICQHTDRLHVYETKIKSLLECCYTQNQSRNIVKLQISCEAMEAINDFRRELLAILSTNNVRNMISFLEKAHGKAVRLAGAFHLWKYDKLFHENKIGLNEVTCGIELTRLLIAHAEFAFSDYGLRGYRDADRIIQYLLRSHFNEVHSVYNSREIEQYIRGIDRERACIALNILENHGYIRQYRQACKKREFILNSRFFCQRTNFIF
ncbi:DUF3987 domain-containing protein [Desulfovibrio sp. TomC]|uniref:DUF3987 domain-containing protein n=1 Tax=Desulfovibrio sp. TomC TaxID=1562888 RepID=UPI000575916A|nr:DUF3987 domain-containing protein [Desulfovibrio sp. TomC]KHK00178.1 hypothetical protein NY78_4415 [Desulfovibrio sp. TomC]